MPNQPLELTQMFNKGFFSQLGSEYICTGFMVDMPEAQLLSSEYEAHIAHGLVSSQVGGDPTIYTTEALTGQMAAQYGKATLEQSQPGAAAAGSALIGGTVGPTGKTGGMGY